MHDNNKIRLQKTWDVTFEVNQFGEKDKAIHYFFGFPKNRDHLGLYLFHWFLYTIGLAFLFTPAKNIVKLLTEYIPKWLDAYCENTIIKAKQSQQTHFITSAIQIIFQAWWVSLRPITSPIVSAKAAWKTGEEFADKTGHKNIGKIISLSLTLFSATISFVSMVIVMALVPKAIIGLLSQTGGIIATAANWVGSTLRPLPLLPESVAGISYVTTTAVVSRKLLGRQLDKRTARFVKQKAEMTLVEENQDACHLAQVSEEAPLDNAVPRFIWAASKNS